MDNADFQHLLSLVKAHRDALLPLGPQRAKGVRRRSDEWIDAISAWQESCENVDDLLERFEKFVAGLESPRAEERRSGWIPVNERLPTMHQTVLCWIVGDDHDRPCIGTLNEGHRKPYFAIGRRDFTLKQVSHWMPLPDGPSTPQEKP